MDNDKPKPTPKKTNVVPIKGTKKPNTLKRMDKLNDLVSNVMKVKGKDLEEVNDQKKVIDWEPTAEDRHTVSLLILTETPLQVIAANICPYGPMPLALFKKVFDYELKHGPAQLNVEVVKTFHKMATSGRQPQTTLSWMRAYMGLKDSYFQASGGGNKSEADADSVAKQLQDSQKHMMSTLPKPEETKVKSG